VLLTKHNETTTEQNGQAFAEKRQREAKKCMATLAGAQMEQNIRNKSLLAGIQNPKLINDSPAQESLLKRFTVKLENERAIHQPYIGKILGKYKKVKKLC